MCISSRTFGMLATGRIFGVESHQVMGSQCCQITTRDHPVVVLEAGYELLWRTIQLVSSTRFSWIFGILKMNSRKPNTSVCWFRDLPAWTDTHALKPVLVSVQKIAQCCVPCDFSTIKKNVFFIFANSEWRTRNMHPNYYTLSVIQWEHYSPSISFYRHSSRQKLLLKWIEKLLIVTLFKYIGSPRSATWK